jgi:hypothetical protein
MKVNFFWKGEDFDDFNKICILSHLKVGHDVVLWLSGPPPNTDSWYHIANKISLMNANYVFDVTDFINGGGNLQTASDLWRFHFLYEYGGWYSDTDAFAIQHFHEDKEWVICSSETDERLSIGIIKAPPKHPIFLDCITDIKKNWGNVNVFSNAYNKFFGNTSSTVPNEEYYPWRWDEWDTLYSDITLDYLRMHNVKSIHLYHTMLKRNGIKYFVSEDPCILNEMINYVI